MEKIILFAILFLSVSFKMNGQVMKCEDLKIDSCSRELDFRSHIYLRDNFLRVLNLNSSFSEKDSVIRIWSMNFIGAGIQSYPYLNLIELRVNVKSVSLTIHKVYWEGKQKNDSFEIQIKNIQKCVCEEIPNRGEIVDSLKKLGLLKINLLKDYYDGGGFMGLDFQYLEYYFNSSIVILNFSNRVSPSMIKHEREKKYIEFIRFLNTHFKSNLADRL